MTTGTGLAVLAAVILFLGLLALDHAKARWEWEKDQWKEPDDE